MRPVYHQLPRHNAATLWTYIHVLQPCASLQGLHAMCTCPAHTESSLFFTRPGHYCCLNTPPLLSYKALSYMVQRSVCCEMQRCQEQCPRSLSFNHKFGWRDKWSTGNPIPERRTLVVVAQNHESAKILSSNVEVLYLVQIKSVSSRLKTWTDMELFWCFDIFVAYVARGCRSFAILYRNKMYEI